MIANEDGPFGLFECLRARMGVNRDEKGNNYGTNNFAVGLVCQWCNSIWIGINLSLCYMRNRDKTIAICRPLALSSIAVVMSEMTKALTRYTDG